MTDINKVVIVGRLTADFNLKYTGNGLAIGDGSIAVNRTTKSKDGNVNNEVSYFTFKILGKTAEALKQYLTKGKQVAIDGYMKQDRWQDKQDGKARSQVYIGVESIELLGGKTEGQPQNQTPAQQNQNYQQQQYQQPFGADFPEDIPW